MLKSDSFPDNCSRCGHSQYVHAGPEKTGACNAYGHKTTQAPCLGFVAPGKKERLTKRIDQAFGTIGNTGKRGALGPAGRNGPEGPSGT